MAGNQKHRPKVIAFDVVETLFDLQSVGARLRDLGVGPGALETWFAQLLRDAFALDTSGSFKPFPEVAASSLAVLLHHHGIESIDDQLRQVLDGFSRMPPHPDVRPALELVNRAGLRAITLSNGSQQSTVKLLEQAGLRELIWKVISIDEVRHWKPRAEVYLHAAKLCDVEPNEMALIAAHSWDTQGAGRAGLTTGWVGRKNQIFAAAMDPPDVQGKTLVEVVNALLAL